ncbi:hypothetical protein L861_14705 [Litchfieldella anticariensis FP35 = DSM 16096]|uniref:Uncharacterized protein n=1 Tax=Litchfieldella anticariensis (strain DSM 16096 / CECT 5854 / CIP 108499 / LMG 22089 / FP35) TaxID=1121939 RepID=S2KDA2_LITA3|nr:hypothetical protein [Halomonas anticariensis]EPC00177.1 hypothetical protein L861_14705 [Halomonas anticariensis FP35 = DSM 16096]
MNDNSKYPSWRVIIGFTLCPAAVALFIMSAVMFLGLLFEQDMRDGWWETFGGLPAILLLTSLTALYLFGVPAFLLAVLYSLMKLRKSLQAYLIVFVAGGSGAQVWTWLPVTTASSDEGLFGFPSAFFMGAVSSLIMAFFVLPKHEKEKVAGNISPPRPPTSG